MSGGRGGRRDRGRVPAQCHPELWMYGKGLCANCYHREYDRRRRESMGKGAKRYPFERLMLPPDAGEQLDDLLPFLRERDRPLLS